MLHSTSSKQLAKSPSRANLTQGLPHSPPKSPLFTSSSSKDLQMASTVSRLVSSNTKKLEKIESLRKDQLVSEIRTLQDRPNISENSKKIFKNYVPLYKRLNEVVKNKQEHIKSLQIEAEISKKAKFKVNCTFQPNNTSPISNGDNGEFAERMYRWEYHRKQKQERMKQMKFEESNFEMRQRPYISNKSQGLSENRSATPVFDRLYEVKAKENLVELTFKPDVSPHANRIFKGKRDGPIFERLYSLRKLNVSHSPE